jgi:hypothetical protein
VFAFLNDGSDGSRLILKARAAVLIENSQCTWSNARYEAPQERGLQFFVRREIHLVEAGSQ